MPYGSVPWAMISAPGRASAARTRPGHYQDGTVGHRLDDNFYCLSCGRVNGVLGATPATYADRIKLWESDG